MIELDLGLTTMTVPKRYQADVEMILARLYDNGGDLWSTADGRFGVGSPFSTLECALMLSELGMDVSEPILKRTAELIMSSWRGGGGFRLAPKSAIYSCHTSGIFMVFCSVG